jgi:hypothetical protein
MAFIYDLVDTWNNGATTFTAIKMNVTDTASNVNSLLMDLQVGGSSLFNVTKGGVAAATAGFTTAGNALLNSNSSQLIFGASSDLVITRDAADTLAQRRGVNAQTSRIYNTYTDASNYERLELSWSSNIISIGPTAAGTGAVRSMQFSSGGTGRWTLNTSGHLLANADNTYDIGASGATRPRRFYLGGGSLTGAEADSSLTISPIWNTTGTPTAMLLNVTDTASNAASRLMDLQVGGSTRFNVDKNGNVRYNGTVLMGGASRGYSGGIFFQPFFTSFFEETSTPSASNAVFGYGPVGGLGAVTLKSTCRLGWATGNATPDGDLYLFRDAAGTLAQRNGVNAQTSRIYNTYTDASNYERGKMEWASNVLRIGTEKAGTGTARALELQTDGVTRMTIATSGAATFSSTINSGSHIVIPAGSNLFFGNRALINTPASGILLIANSSGTDFDRLQFGGTTNAFGAVARDGAGIKFVGGDGTSTAHIKVPGVTVANLPAAATAGAGARSFVTNALTPVFGSAVIGGGAVNVPVYSDGSAWNVG